MARELTFEKIRRQQARTAVPLDEHDVAMTQIVTSVSVALQQVNVDKEIAAKVIQLLEERCGFVDEEADEASNRQIETDQLRGTTLPAIRKLPN